MLTSTLASCSNRLTARLAGAVSSALARFARDPFYVDLRLVRAIYAAVAYGTSFDLTG